MTRTHFEVAPVSKLTDTSSAWEGPDGGFEPHPAATVNAVQKTNAERTMTRKVPARVQCHQNVDSAVLPVRSSPRPRVALRDDEEAQGQFDVPGSVPLAVKPTFIDPLLELLLGENS